MHTKGHTPCSLSACESSGKEQQSEVTQKELQVEQRAAHALALGNCGSAQTQLTACRSQPESLAWCFIWVMLQTAEGILKPVGQPELPAGGIEP